MNRQALVIALLSAVVGVVLLQLYIRRFEDEVRGGEPVPILFVRKDVPAGAVLTAGAIAERTVPRAYLDQRHVLAADRGRVLGTRVSTSVKVNDALLWTDIALMRERRTLADLVPDGMRAVTIASSTFDGLLRPGDRVDVVFLARKQAVASEYGVETKAVTLLQGVLVLAIKGNISREAESKNSSGGSVTLLMSSEQAQLLLVSEMEGTLKLILRNSEDLELRDNLGVASSGDIRDPARRAKYLRAHGLAAAGEQEDHHAR